MTDATAHPRGLNLPRDDDGLARTTQATRRVQQLLPTFLADFVADVGADGVVVVLDGGLDSAVTAALAADGLSPDRVTGLVMPARISDEACARRAEAVASMLDVPFRRLPLQPLLGAFQETVGESGQPADDLVATGNALDRLRTACAYYVANTSNALVVGSTNRTDRLLGPLTKYGDTGVDCYLLADLYRTEVDALADRLDVPEGLRDRSTAPTYAAQTAADRLGVAPETVDRILRSFVDEGRDASTVADDLGVAPELVTRVGEWCAETRHKRHQPPKPSTYL